MRKTSLIAAVACLAMTASASATFMEFEPNNTNATGNMLMYMPGADTYDLGLASLAAGGGDVDVYKFWIAPGPQGGTVVNAMVTPLNPVFGAVPDTIATLSNCATGAVLVQADDGVTTPSGNLGSALSYLYTGPGPLLVCLSVTGWPDFGNTGAHFEEGDYSITLSILGCQIPEPSTLALLGLGALGLIRRRK
jgi:hypothetical protein